MKCPSREHIFWFAPELSDAGVGYIQQCPDCHRYWTRDGVEVIPEDLHKHNPKDSDNEIEWDIDDLSGGSYGF